MLGLCRLSMYVFLGSILLQPQGLLGAAEEPIATAPIYHWDPATYRAWDGAPFQAAPEPDGQGGTRSRLTITGKQWNYLINVPVGVLQGGQAYTATLAYEVITSPVFPGTFHMFARSKSLGQGKDVWIDWIGESGDRGVVRLPMNLPPADDWTFTVGSKGPAALAIEHFDIHAGTGYTIVPATNAEDTTTPATGEKPMVAATGSKTVIIDPPQPTNDLEVSTAEFAMTADSLDAVVSSEVAMANAKALGLALVACRERGAARLVIPPGVYRLDAKDSIRIEDLHDLTIDGQGAELIATRLMRTPLFQLSRCERVVITNLVIDWDWTHSPIASLAVVEAIAEDQRSCTLRFPDLTAADMAPVADVPWTHLWEVDPATMRTVSNVSYHIKVSQREVVDGNAIKATFTSSQPLAVGKSFIIRHLYYEMGVFKMSDVHHLVFDTVTIHSMPGMGWIGRGDLDHIGLRHCRIVRRAGSRHPLTTAADGFHILESQGNILIEDCEFTGSGDDCINIHDNCAQGVRKTGPTSLVLVDNPRWRMKVAEGDRLEFFHPDFSPSGFDGIVQKVTYVGNDTQLEFSEALPEVVSPLSIVFNRRYGTTDVQILNNHFEHGRVMLSAERVTIAGNDFDHPFANALQLHTEIVLPHWSEGSGASNWVIRDNTFRSANMRGKFTGAVIHGAPVIPAGRTDYPIFHTILIEENRFFDSYGPIVSLAACAEVIVRNNRIESAAELPEANAHAGAVEIQRCEGVDVSGNTWVAGPGQRLPGVVYETVTTADVRLVGNRLVSP